jgi:hypothetical protein
MQKYLLLLLIAIFVIAYLLQSVLMVGYDYFKFRSKNESSGNLPLAILKKILGLSPLFQRKLKPKGYDVKVQQRYQQKFTIYYSIIWATLFLILFLAAKLYLDAF